jgi:hypothetical protein
MSNREPIGLTSDFQESVDRGVFSYANLDRKGFYKEAGGTAMFGVQVEPSAINADTNDNANVVHLVVPEATETAADLPAQEVA